MQVSTNRHRESRGAFRRTPDRTRPGNNLLEDDYDIGTIYTKKSPDNHSIIWSHDTGKPGSNNYILLALGNKISGTIRKHHKDFSSARRIKFDRLADAWIQETQFLSNPKEIILNRNYLRIIGMGEHALPFIYTRLKASRDPWFTALEAITDHTPEIHFSGQSLTQAYQNYWLLWLGNNGHAS